MDDVAKKIVDILKKHMKEPRDDISLDTALTDLKIESLDVIGYGTTKRKDFTGAVSSVKMENSPLANMPNQNALEALKGNVTGLNIGAVTTAGGQPGVLIRGQRSISGSNDPLI